ncbi:MAG: glycosyltransferase family 25 protein [Rickettsiales bacterium]
MVKKAKSNEDYQVLVINLDKDVKRWDDISKSCAAAGIKCNRFPATNGAHIKITNLENNQVFYGIDLKKDKFIEQNKKYQITCDSNDSKTFEFNFIGYTYKKNSVSSGELGLWCSELKALYAVKDSGKSLVLLEDDVKFFGNFIQNFENFYEHLPASADVALLDYRLKSSKDTLIPVNEYVHTFGKQASGYATWAMLFTPKGINKILSVKEYSYPTDKFYWCISNGNLGARIHSNFNCHDNKGLIEMYGSSVGLIDITGAESTIASMGREF